MLKNYRSEMLIGRIFESIMKMLASHGAGQIAFEYGGEGRVVGISFVVETPRGVLSIRLPAKIENVARVMELQRADGWRNREQVYRTAWKNIHDWIAAQMALLETEMVKLEEIFLPYIADREGRTLFERMEERGFLLGPGEAREAEGNGR